MYSLILNRGLGFEPLGYGIAFAREHFAPQCGTIRCESGFSRAPMRVPDPEWETPTKNYLVIIPVYNSIMKTGIILKGGTDILLKSDFTVGLLALVLFFFNSAEKIEINISSQITSRKLQKKTKPFNT